ncbi:MAG TPA: hypothetical protein VEV44_00930 [Pseudoneobacillus sp.]|nr:hypothetical protein [Pseudoneobacillus sp.]
MKKQLILAFLIIFITSITIHLSNVLSSYHQNGEYYKVVLNEQLDDQNSYFKNDDKHHFFMVLSILTLYLNMTVVMSRIHSTPYFLSLKRIFLTPIFYQSNYLIKPSLMF